MANLLNNRNDSALNATYRRALEARHIQFETIALRAREARGLEQRVTFRNGVFYNAGMCTGTPTVETTGNTVSAALDTEAITGPPTPAKSPAPIPWPEEQARTQCLGKREFGLSPNLQDRTIKQHEEDTEVTLIFNQHPYIYKHTLPKTGLTITIVRSPTGNCQVYSISDFKFILKEEENGGTSALDTLKTIHKRFRKNLLMLDVNDMYSGEVQKLFKDCILSETEYDSTSGSNMVLYLVKTENL